MAIHMCEVNLDGASWKFNTIPGLQGVSTFAKFMHLVGEPFFRVKGLLNGLDADIDEEALAIGIRILTERAAEGDLPGLIQTLLQGLLKDGKAVQFDNEFSANYGLLLKLFVYSAKENFGSFLPGLSTLGDIGPLLPQA